MEMLLTVEQAATRLQVAQSTVRRLLASGELRGIKRGKLWRVPENALTESAAPASQWETAAGRAAPIYADSLANDGELTLATTAPSDFYEYGD
jgi:excisionase family DNA binding protein